MTSVERTGRDIETATELALAELGVTEDDVDVEIIEEVSKGFLGLGHASITVRATLKEPITAQRKQRQKVQPSEDVSDETESAESMVEPDSEAPITSVRETAEFSRLTLQRIVDSIGSGGKVIVKNAMDDYIELDMVEGDSAILIGKHGQTINSLQYLLGIMVNKRIGNKIRLVIDAEGYRGRREDTLRKQAISLANKVKQTNEEAVLDPLSPSERRIIHVALANDPDVCTYSEGQDPVRRVVISPKK